MQNSNYVRYIAGMSEPRIKALKQEKSHHFWPSCERSVAIRN